MPLFILISGYFTRKKDGAKSFLKSLLPIIVPLIIFQFINILALCVFCRRALDFSFLLTPYWTLWYLLSLIFWRVIIQYTPSWLLEKPLLRILTATILSLLCGLMPNGRILSLRRTITFYPFFLFGYYMGKGIVKSKFWNNTISYSIIMIVALLILFDLYPSNTSILLKGADQYSISDIPAKIYLFACSTTMSLSVFNVVKEQKLLSAIGKNSLFYYLYHALLISYFISVLIHHFSFPNTFIFLIFYCIFILGVIYVFSRINIFRWLVYPTSKQKNKM